MPNTYKSLGRAKRQQFLDSRATAGAIFIIHFSVAEALLGLYFSLDHPIMLGVP
ncbi:hypothetical protein Fleli_3650 [Bernardetia litoralis DSM 6794]|uniref:Uncharacterized protein n=1 Tax=Bernardetia litoralis (strain ATCC 23117 / DSM 6794 / NBRC 15988 / NCIMB 1366 / Fx l1 / Sio-4) TaxID=880071 RepID=I4APT0_BERLS|nr:hypothetical protein Fleli_3650 [Bernardetia litoralis DSM 6794]